MFFWSSISVSYESFSENATFCSKKNAENLQINRIKTGGDLWVMLKWQNIIGIALSL